MTPQELRDIYMQDDTTPKWFKDAVIAAEQGDAEAVIGKIGLLLNLLTPLYIMQKAERES